MANIPIEVNTGETKTITFHTSGTFNTEDIVFSISSAGGDANTTISGVAYCNTAAATAAKTATMPGFELVTGQRILLQTTNTNSATSNVTLSVNGTTAKPIKIGTASTNPTASNFPAAWWIANYDGTNWVLTNHSHSFSSITSRGEAYLEWGGRNLASTYSPIDAAMVGNLGANRTAFVSPNAVTVEYSRDGGTTWTDYGASDSSKTGFFTDFRAAPIFYIGKSTSSNPADANCQLRVTLSTAGNSVYTTLNKFIIYVTTSGSAGTWCSIDARLQSNVTSNTDTWKNFANRVSVLGWSGYNVINTSGITTYGNAASSQYGQVRFTFGCTGVSSSNYPGLGIYGVNCYGGVGWATPSTMASNGRLYSFDMSKNATFPAKITATQFVKSGGTSTQFLMADGSVNSNTYVTSPTSDITLSTSPQTYIISGSTERKIALPSTDPYTSARIPSSHKHGNIQNDGTLQATDITIANGDKLIVTDSSESNKISRASITFDGSTKTKFLSQKGTWESPSSSTVTVPDNNITLSTTASTYITVDGTSRTIALPTSFPTSWIGVTATTASRGNHGHGTISNGGYIQGNTSQSGGVANNQVAIANGDRLVIGDYSDRSDNYHKLKLTSIVFDGSTTTQFLSKKGTWETPSGSGGSASMAVPPNSLGTVKPLDSISSFGNSPNYMDYTLTTKNDVELLRVNDDEKEDISFLLPICMDNLGHLYIPLTENLRDFLLNNGYTVRN